jgi:hypothetical protein
MSGCLFLVISAEVHACSTMQYPCLKSHSEPYAFLDTWQVQTECVKNFCQRMHLVAFPSRQSQRCATSF